VSTVSQIRAEAALGKPAVRAKFLQIWLTSFAHFDQSAVRELDRIVGEDTRRGIMERSMLSWIPIALDIQIVDAVCAVLGRERFAAFTRAYVSEIMPRAPLGALIDLGTKMMGVSPESFLRWWDRGWRAVYRHCGASKGIVRGDGQGSIVYEKLPAACAHSAAFVDAIVSSSYAAYAWTGHNGSVRIADLRPDDGYLELALAWQVRKRS
jgi:hypothetical protein